MEHAANAAHLLAATRATRTAVHEMRQRRAVTGRLLRGRTIGDQDATVIWREPEHDRTRYLRIGSEHRSGEAAGTAPRQRDRTRDVVARHDRADRTERLDRMHRSSLLRIAAQQQQRWHERTAVRVRAIEHELVRIADDELP